jgi:hypothetical protein
MAATRRVLKSINSTTKTILAFHLVAFNFYSTVPSFALADICSNFSQAWCCDHSAFKRKHMFEIYIKDQYMLNIKPVQLGHAVTYVSYFKGLHLAALREIINSLIFNQVKMIHKKLNAG